MTLSDSTASTRPFEGRTHQPGDQVCLKPGKSTGLDKCPNELKKTIMRDKEFQIVKMWMNEILTEDTSRQ